MKTFNELYDELQGTFEEDRAFRVKIDNDFDSELKLLMSKSKKVYSRALAMKVLGDAFSPIFNKYNDIVKKCMNDMWERRKILKEEMCKAVEIEGIKSSEDAIKVESICEQSYQSQGWGARKYARGAAMLEVLELGAIGIKAEVREKLDKYDFGNLMTYEVWAWIGEPLKYEYKPSRLSLREAVKSCWANGINPRVIYFFLPPDFEEKEGLDHFGGEVEKVVKDLTSEGKVKEEV